MDHNLLRNIPLNLANHRTPRSVNDVVDIVRSAVPTRRTIRAVGSAWSFSDCIYTEDELIEMGGLNQILGFIRIGRGPVGDSPVLRIGLRSSILREDRIFVHAQAGVLLESLNRRLNEYHITLPTMGSSSGQTIAGAVSTGTHGAHFDRPPLADYLRAILIVDPGGNLHWIERAGNGAITDPTRYPARPSIDREIEFHYDDEMFRAAMVSLGCLGIVVEVILECRPQYLISRVGSTTTWGNMRQWLGERALGSATPFPPGIRHPTDFTPIPEALEIFLSPHRRDDNYASPSRNYMDRDCRIVSYARAQTEETSTGREYIGSVRVDEESIVADVEGHGHGGLRQAARTIMEAVRPDTNGYFLSHTVLSTYSGRTRDRIIDGRMVHGHPIEPTPGFTLEVVVPAQELDYLRYIDELLEQFDDLQSTGHNLAGFYSIRFTRGTEALLGMQQFETQRPDELVCHIEFQALKEFNFALGLTATLLGLQDLPGRIDHGGNLEGRSDDHFKLGEDMASSFPGKMHWAQMNRLNRTEVLADYGDNLHRWRRVRTSMTTSGDYRTFSNHFSRRCGLEANHEAVVPTSWGPNRFDLFFLSNGGDLDHAWYGGSWGRPETFRNAFPDGDKIVGPIDAVSWGEGRIDLFGVGQSGRLLQWWYYRVSPPHWSSPFSVDVPLAGPLAVAAPNPGRLEIIALVMGGDLHHYWHIDGRWHNRRITNGLPSGRRIVGGLTATAWNADRLDLLGIDNFGRVVHLFRDGRDDFVWQNGPRTRNGDNPIAPPAMLSQAPFRLDAFLLNRMGGIELVRYTRDTRSWNHIETIEPNSFPTGEVRFDHPEAFGHHIDDAYYTYRRQDGRRWFAGPIAATASGGLRTDLFGIDGTGDVLQLWRMNDDDRWKWSHLGRKRP